MRIDMAVIVAVCLAMFFAGNTSLAQEGDGPAVLILGSPSLQPYCEGDPEIACLLDADCAAQDICLDPWNDDVKDKLDATGLFSVVDIIRIGLVNPSLIDLESYDSVLVYSDSAIPPYYRPAQGEEEDFIEFGDFLADYVDSGGGVVVAVFANASLPFEGRFNDDDYWVITPLGQDQGTILTLGGYDPGSPLLTSVTDFSGGEGSYVSTGILHPDAEAVAGWSNGYPLVAKRHIGASRRVDLNFYPPSSDARFDFWDAATDGAHLIANALLYVTCGGDTDGDLVCDAHDNCTRTSNPDQADEDSDGLGDVCEPYSEGVFINEVHYHQLAFNVEFIELYSTVTAGPIDITGWHVTDQDDGGIDFQFSSADPRFTCGEPFLLNFRDRVVLRQGPIPAGSATVCTGPVRQFWLLNTQDQLQNDGDDILLQAADASCRDFIQFENGASVDLPPADCLWAGPNPSNGNSQGFSMSRFDMDPFMDTDSGIDWERSGDSTTLGNRTPGMMNVGGLVDRDGDGVLDGTDNCPDTPNSSQEDTDSDGLGNACDTDVDNDGILDGDDNCQFDSNPSQADADSDGIGDVCDVCTQDPLNDYDHDGICGDVDNCPRDFNITQIDTDSDSWGDDCDNCPTYFNFTQLDSDDDHVGNVCDNCPGYNPGQLDTDDDAIGNACDNCDLDYNPAQLDSDSDGTGDVCTLGIFFDAPEFVQWQDVPSYGSYNFFKGDLEVLKSSGIYTQESGSNEFAEQLCGLTNPWSADASTLPPGKALFFLVSGSGSSDSGLGTDSSGQERLDTSDCP